MPSLILPNECASALSDIISFSARPVATAGVRGTAASLRGKCVSLHPMAEDDNMTPHRICQLDQHRSRLSNFFCSSPAGLKINFVTLNENFSATNRRVAQEKIPSPALSVRRL